MLFSFLIPGLCHLTEWHAHIQQIPIVNIFPLRIRVFAAFLNPFINGGTLRLLPYFGYSKNVMSAAIIAWVHAPLQHTDLCTSGRARVF